MLSSFRNRFGTAGLAVSVIALVVALAGGAIAANGGGDGKATASAKAKRGPKGPKGPPGPAGSQGPAGPQGPAGAQGPAGPAGANGVDGKDGATGPTGKTGATGPTGSAGTPGATGATGATGPTGPAGGVGGALPPGVTQTGVWVLGAAQEKITTEVEGNKEEVTVGPAKARGAISFTMPLSAQLTEAKVHYSNEPNFTDFDEAGSETIGCEGAPAAPSAPQGHLCVYGPFSFGAGTVEKIRRPGGGVFGTSRFGAEILVLLDGTGEAFGGGTWAVTGF
jgi:Collagen triple helix repeat (20 copies)